MYICVLGGRSSIQSRDLPCEFRCYIDTLHTTLLREDTAVGSSRHDEKRYFYTVCLLFHYLQCSQGAAQVLHRYTPHTSCNGSASTKNNDKITICTASHAAGGGLLSGRGLLCRVGPPARLQAGQSATTRRLHQGCAELCNPFQRALLQVTTEHAFVTQHVLLLVMIF